MIRIILIFWLIDCVDSPPRPQRKNRDGGKEDYIYQGGGPDAVWEQILKMLLPSAENLQSAYNT
jgi:hypothetical protein